MKEFYDIAEREGQEPDNRFQLKNFGPRRHLMTVGRPVRSGLWGEKTEYISETTYRNTVPEDYMKDFVYTIQKFDPIYEIDMFLDHHMSVYGQRGNDKQTFIKHVKYQVKPLLEKREDSKPHVELIEKWLTMRDNESKDGTESNASSQFNFGDINAPALISINSPNSSQNQEINYSKEEVHDFLNLMKKDAENLKHDLKEELLLEIQTAQSQLRRGKPMQAKVFHLLKLTKEIGFGVFTNLAASPIYEALKPSLGL